MKIEKLPSGSYRIRKMFKGKTYTVITDYKPTQKEAIKLLADKLDKVQDKYERLTFQAAGSEYIESKRNVLSPSTVRGYSNIMKMLSPKFLNENVHDIAAMDIQTEINRISKNKSPKTARNYHGFISAVLSIYCPNLNIHTTLPQKIKNEPYIPSDDDVRKILEHAKNGRYEIPIILACYGMRRSEICALTTDDIEGDVIHINKALVENDKKEWVVKTTKTTESLRDIVIPLEIANRIRAQGYVYKGSPGAITQYLSRTQNALGIPHFPLHKLRHYFASKMSAMNIPEADIMRFGGWETDYVMKGVYRHAMQDKNREMQRDAAKRLGESIFQ